MNVTQTIQSELDRTETEKNVTIFFACESGSRAWGFESQDSDYDVRFLYAHKTEWYLSVDSKRDVIERPISDVLDISGWDLRKALGLMKRSNPPLMEWLRSPIQYRDRVEATRYVRELVPKYYSPIAAFHHYLHMARGNYRDYLKGDEVWVKKYFYVLRPVLACIWIERGLGIVPMEFASLVEGVLQGGPLRKGIARLLEAKKSGRELDWGPRIPEMSDFLAAELERLSGSGLESPRRPDTEHLDRAFRAVLIVLNGNDISRVLRGHPPGAYPYDDGKQSDRILPTEPRCPT